MNHIKIININYKKRKGIAIAAWITELTMQTNKYNVELLSSNQSAVHERTKPSSSTTTSTWAYKKMGRTPLRLASTKFIKPLENSTYGKIKCKSPN